MQNIILTNYKMLMGIDETINQFNNTVNHKTQI